MAEHIHWKKTTNPDYLGTFAFEKDEEKIVKIADVKIEKVNNPGGSPEECPVMYFEGNIKPNKWILNVTNMKRIQKATGTPYMDEWVGGDQLALAMETMAARYGCEFMFCRPEDAGRVIKEVLNNEAEKEPE